MVINIREISQGFIRATKEKPLGSTKKSYAKLKHNKIFKGIYLEEVETEYYLEINNLREELIRKLGELNG